MDEFRCFLPNLHIASRLKASLEKVKTVSLSKVSWGTGPNPVCMSCSLKTRFEPRSKEEIRFPVQRILPEKADGLMPFVRPGESVYFDDKPADGDMGTSSLALRLKVHCILWRKHCLSASRRKACRPRIAGSDSNGMFFSFGGIRFLSANTKNASLQIYTFLFYDIFSNIGAVHKKFIGKGIRYMPIGEDLCEALYHFDKLESDYRW